jgi:hypothetical protein
MIGAQAAFGEHGREDKPPPAHGANVMATGLLNSLIPHVRRAALLQDGGELTDGQLLECFLARREEAAFEALLRRHGPMVLGICRRVLHHAHDIEDAFQATFLVLVRKASGFCSVRRWATGCTAWPTTLP